MIYSSTKKRSQAIVKGSLFIFLSLIVGLRGIEIGNDTYEYFNLYNKYGSLNGVNEAFNYAEFGYVIYNYILFQISTDPIIITLTSSLFFYYIYFYVFMKDNDSFWFGLIIFINSVVFFFTFSGIRQTIALAIVMLAYKILPKSSPKFYLLILLASTFHTSSIVFIFLPFIKRIKFNYKVMMNYLLFGIITFVIFEPFINTVVRVLPKYSVYLDSTFFTAGKIGSLADFVMFLFLYSMVILIAHQKGRGVSSRGDDELNLL